MNTIQTVIVYLWFAPVLGFIVIPLLWSVVGMLYRAAERARLVNIMGYVVLNNRDKTVHGASENRGRSRILLEQKATCIVEKEDCSKASVLNMSQQGICLHDETGKLESKTEPLRIVLRTRRQDYAVTARPVWRKLTSRGCEIGAKIDRIPSNWNDLVAGLNQSLAAKPA